jgi:hypothetical protein
MGGAAMPFGLLVSSLEVVCSASGENAFGAVSHFRTLKPRKISESVKFLLLSLDCCV